MIIYKVTNIENNKVYIGKTVRTLNERKWAHYDSARNLGSETNFHRALMKYPKKSFVWEVVATAHTKEELGELEIKFIKEYNSFKVGYNMTEGGDGGFTYKKGTEMYERIKHKLGKWKDGNPGATPDAISKRVKTFSKKTDWKRGEEHPNYGHSHNKGIMVGIKNPMYGKTPTNARPVEIDGVVYNSLTKASQELRVSKATIANRIKRLKNYKYID